MAPSDDDWPVAKRRIVALLDRGIKGVAIEVRDGEGMELGMKSNTRASA
jgi:hypothetical protein